jgi:ABC transporter substrate binding protein
VLQPDLMFGQSTPTTAALLQQTSTISIVFFSVGDPVGEEFVESLSRPGRNLTGFINMEGAALPLGSPSGASSFQSPMLDCFSRLVLLLF